MRGALNEGAGRGTGRRRASGSPLHLTSGARVSCECLCVQGTMEARELMAAMTELGILPQEEVDFYLTFTRLA